MMELSENVSYMKLLHELKGAFPNMADDLIHQCIKQVKILSYLVSCHSQKSIFVDNFDSVFMYFDSAIHSLLGYHNNCNFDSLTS